MAQQSALLTAFLSPLSLFFSSCCQIKLLLKRLVTTEEDLTTMTSQLSSTASSARKTKYIDEAAVAVSNAVKVHVKLELSITNRKGHEKLAMPGAPTIVLQV